MSQHALSPVAAEQRLVELEKKLETATEMLKLARDAEVEAKHEWEAARRRAGFDKNCPVVVRGAGWLLPKLNPAIDPTQEPIQTIHGWVVLDDLGNRTACDPPEEVVA